MGRPSNQVERRAQIVEGLRQVMAEKGYAGATVNQIAQSAGLASGLVHYHFATKRDILLALTQDLADRVQKRFEQRSCGSAADRVHAWIGAHLELGTDADITSLACWVAIGAEAVRDPWTRDAYTEVVRRDLAVLEALLQDAGTPNPPADARTLLAAVEGFYRLSAGAPGTLEPGSAHRSVVAIFQGMCR